MVKAIASIAWPVWFKRGVGHAPDHVGVADGHRKRGVLRQVQVLRGERGDHHPQGLRQHHQPQAAAAGWRLRARGGFVLALGYGQDAAAHDLGDEGGGVDRQAHVEAR